MPTSHEPAGRLATIWIKHQHRAPLDEVDTAILIEDEGLDGNVDRGGRRQVTLIECEVWDTLREELGPELRPTARRANLLVSGIPLAHTTGRVLIVGTCRIRIEGETRPCGRMDEEFPGLQEALKPDWRAGAFGVVLTGGSIATGDPVAWESLAERQDP
jgi:MOSC domain-containing protein YiiM